MSDPTSVINRKIANRVSTAIRWHKLTDLEQVSRFVFDDPEIRAFCDDEAFEHERLYFMVSAAVDELWAAYEAEDPEQRIAELRRKCGDKLVDLLIEIRNAED